MLFNLIDILAGKWFDWRARQLRPKIENDLIINRVELDEFGLKVIMEHPAIAIMAEHAAAMLDEWEAENYVQFDLMPRPDITKGKPIRVTVQWAHGMSPGTKNLFLEESLKAISRCVESEYYTDGFARAQVRVVAKLALDGVDWEDAIEAMHKD